MGQASDVQDLMCTACIKPDDDNTARLLVASVAHSSNWLQALPASSCVLRLGAVGCKVTVGFRVINLCDRHCCLCSAIVDSCGIRGLSCKNPSARITRHSYINDTIHRALVLAKFASVKEPVGLSFTDGKRIDGLTLAPEQVSKNILYIYIYIYIYIYTIGFHSCRYVKYTIGFHSCRYIKYTIGFHSCRYIKYTIGFHSCRYHCKFLFSVNFNHCRQC